MNRRVRTSRALSLVGFALATALFAPTACNGGPEAVLRAKVIEDRSELVGGPVSAADVGDFLLENDQIRAAILGSRSSPAPGVYGGSLVDLDRRRPQNGFEGGNGHDRFSETFPIANLLVPDPKSTEISVLKDGSDGEAAVVRVEGDGEFLYEALAVLRNQSALLATIFPNVRTNIHFVTDYSLAPGDRFIKIRTELSVTSKDDTSCPGVGSCGLACEHGYAQDQNGCRTCECSKLLPLDVYDAPHSVFGGILGDTPTIDDPPAELRAGVVAGDFVFFGNQNNVFAPGVGFDEDEAVQAAANAGRNTFTTPLTYDFVAAAGRDVSYGYVSLAPEGQAHASVNVPIFASAATAFLVGGKQCFFDTGDDDACDKHRAFVFERYLVVGDGDINSVTAEMARLRGDAQGTVTGFVSWAETGEPVANAQVVVMVDPDPSVDFATLDEVARANREARGDVGVVDEIDADLGLDKNEDGDFHGELPPGDYVLVAVDPGYQAVSTPKRVHIGGGETTEVRFALPELAQVDYRITGSDGEAMPGKLTFVALDDKGRPLNGDGRRRVYAGEGRLANGARLVELSASGTGSVRVEPGSYRLYVSRGPEYGAWVEDVTLAPGVPLRVDAALPRQVDTSGWLAIDMHLHSAPSFDSGMAVPRRVTTVVAEGLEVAVSTDHDVATDYEPSIRELGLETQLKSFVSAEVTTLEYGHFIGFPLEYDQLDVPRHNSPDWSCLSGGEILDAIRERAPEGIEPFTVVAHPRDGFFGYIDQSGVDTFTLLRQLDTLNQSNPVLATVSCDFDGMEAMGAKRFDLMRTPTVGEVVDWTRCRGRVDAAEDEPALVAACPEIGDQALAGCGGRELFDDCKRRARSRVAEVFTRRILAHTHEEQEQSFDFLGDEANSQALCDPASYGDAPVPDSVRDRPCAYRAGQIDDFFRYLEHGLTPTQMGSSDSHESLKEPGFPRTYFQSPTEHSAGISATDVVDSLRAGRAVASYGPFVRASIDDKTFGDTASAKPGETKHLLVSVETPDWFGADRLEIYVNGHIVHEVQRDNGPALIEDFRVDAPIVVPARDSWVVIVAMGTRDENRMGPLVFDIPFGEIQLSQTASGAFADVPVINQLLKATPTVPDWSPTVPYALTNPIYLDVDGNGRYDAPAGPPPFCSVPCEVDDDCPFGQVCIGVCGIAIGGGCNIPRTLHGGD